MTSGAFASVVWQPCRRTRTYWLFVHNFPAGYFVKLSSESYLCRMRWQKAAQANRKSYPACDSKLRPQDRPALESDIFLTQPQTPKNATLKPVYIYGPALRFGFINYNLFRALTGNLLLKTSVVRHMGAYLLAEAMLTTLFVTGKHSNCVIVRLSDTLYHCFSLVIFALGE